MLGWGEWMRLIRQLNAPNRSAVDFRTCYLHWHYYYYFGTLEDLHWHYCVLNWSWCIGCWTNDWSWDPNCCYIEGSSEYASPGIPISTEDSLFRIHFSISLFPECLQTDQMGRIVNELDTIQFSIKKASQLVKEIGRQVGYLFASNSLTLFNFILLQTKSQMFFRWRRINASCFFSCSLSVVWLLLLLLR